MISFIEEHRMEHGVEPICKVLPIARRPTTPGLPSPAILHRRALAPVVTRS